MKLFLREVMKWIYFVYYKKSSQENKIIITKIRMFFTLGYWPDFKKPQTFNEKIQRRKFFENNELYIICSDKIEVKSYVTQKIGSEYIIPTLHITNDIHSLSNITFETDVVIKGNHNSGKIIFLKKNTALDLNLQGSFSKKFDIDYGLLSSESWYSDIKPRVLVERKLENSDGTIPNDYKFHVFRKKGNDRKIFLQVDYDRFHDHSRSFYNESGDDLDFSLKCQNKRKPLIKPKNYELMLSLVEKLSEDFSYVRVDLYNVDGKIYFGELTFAHGSGLEKFSPKKYDLILGEFWS